MKTGRRSDVKGHNDHRISCCSDVMAIMTPESGVATIQSTILTPESVAAAMYSPN